MSNVNDQAAVIAALSKRIASLERAASRTPAALTEAQTDIANLEATLSASTNTVLAVASPSSQNSASTSWQTIANNAGGNITASFTKLDAASDVLVTMHGSSYTAGIGLCDFGVNLNGTDYYVARLFFNAADQHQSWSGIHRVTGVPAGTYTLTARYRSSSGAATVKFDPNDTIFLLVSEMPT